MKKYKMIINRFYVSDKDSVDFHVKEGDYFGSLATIISLWKNKNRQISDSQKEIERDLGYLQDNYAITPRFSLTTRDKKKNKINTPKGRLQNQ